MKTTILTALAILLPLGCLAADEIKAFDAKPGLWETTSTMEMSGMPAMPAMPQLTEEQLSKIPPAQRAQVEAMMKQRGAMGGPQTHTSKSCMTKESMQKVLDMANGRKNCSTKLLSSSSSKQEVHIECDEGKAKTSGDITMERVDSEHVKGSALMKTDSDGHTMNMKMTMASKWLSSDCGDVKPNEGK